MIAIIFISADGTRRRITAKTGLSLMENAVARGIDEIAAICGGNAYCGTCRVHVDPGWLDVIGPVTDLELPMIEDANDDDPGARLACQIPVTEALEGLIVRLPKQT